MCGVLRGREAQRRVEDCTARADTLRLCTLTLADDGQPLTDRIDRLYRAFRDLRKTDLWRHHVRGAVAVLETTLGRFNDHWHVHLHVLFEGSFLPHSQLKREWYAATGDSFIVHLKAVHGRKAAARYVAAYIAKPLDVLTWPNARIQEYAEATHGRRLLATSGSFHKGAMDTDDTPDVPPPSTFVAQVTALHRAEEKGCEHTRHALDVLSRLDPRMAVALDRPAQTADGTLPGVDPREVQFAISVCEEVEREFPNLPPPDRLERIRRHFFSLPEPPPPPRPRQTEFQDRAGW